MSVFSSLKEGENNLRGAYFKKLSDNCIQETELPITNTSFRLKELQDPKHLSNLIKRTYLYSSPETVKRLAKYQTYNYQRNNPREFYEMLILVTGVIVSIRHDFTGDWVSIEETLKLN